jgi:hypothetical protein
MKKGNINNNQIYQSIPFQWENVDAYYNLLDAQRHYDDGFRDVIEPTPNENQRVGASFYDEVDDVFKFEIIDLTQEEIEQKAIEESEGNKLNIERQIQENILKQQVQSQVQDLPDAEAIEVADVFPFWDPNGVAYNPDPTQGVKFCKRYDPADYIVKLFRTVQGHDSQADRDPLNTPALFTRIPFPGEILNWKQPTGAQDAYDTGDEVYHDNPNDNGNIWLYRSNIDANTQEPGRDGAFDRWWQPVERKN